MTIRDIQTASVGAFLSFAITLGTVEKSPAFVRWGLFISLAVLVVSFVVDFTHRPWLSANVVATRRTSTGVVVQVGLINHGRVPMEKRIVNVLFPDSLALIACRSDGTPKPDQGLGHTPESVDGIHESDYWQRSMALSPGSHLIYLHVDLPEAGSLIRLNTAGKRRDLFVSCNLGEQHETNFAPIRSTLWKAAGWRPK